MADRTSPHPSMTGQDRRRIATRTLANTSVLASGRVRRPASALTHPHGHGVVQSTI
jgi:hypothetical protein